MSVTRREFLQGAKAVTVGSLLAGCLGSTGVGDESSPTPTVIRARLAPNCPDGITSYDPRWTVTGPGPTDGFKLTLDKDRYRRGEQLNAELRNVTSEKQGAGAKRKFDIQYNSDSGWHTIFGSADPVPYPAVEILFPPGEGHTWTFTLSKQGLAEGVEPATERQACQSIKPGQYRFVFWGIGEKNEAVGETFSVVQD